MKKLLLAVPFLVAFALGASGWFAAVVHWGLSEGKMTRGYQQALLWQFGTNAFTAYLDGPPDAGIYALNFYLKEVDKEQKGWGTNQSVGMLDHWDMDRMRFVANARLALLYEKTGRPDLTSNHLDLAWQSLQHFKRLPPEVKSKGDVLRFIKERDAKHEWF